MNDFMCLPVCSVTLVISSVQIHELERASSVKESVSERMVLLRCWHRCSESCGHCDAGRYENQSGGSVTQVVTSFLCNGVFCSAGCSRLTIVTRSDT